MGPGNIDFVMENVMEKSWNFVLEKMYEPCKYWTHCLHSCVLFTTRTESIEEE